jgi:hypothetical protein
MLHQILEKYMDNMHFKISIILWEEVNRISFLLVKLFFCVSMIFLYSDFIYSVPPVFLLSLLITLAELHSPLILSLYKHSPSLQQLCANVNHEFVV